MLGYNELSHYGLFYHESAGEGGSQALFLGGIAKYVG